MSLTRRRIIFAFFTLLFCLLVPLVLIYATGHNINWQRFSLEKTGSILIDSKPRQATIFLNGQPVKENFLRFLETEKFTTTKTKISGLTPGEYVIRLEYNGYWPWEERFTLTPEEAFNFGVVHLFKQALPQLIVANLAKHGEFSPDKKIFAALEKNTVSLIEIATREKQNVSLPTIEPTAQIIWSSDSKYINIDNWLIDALTGAITNLSEITKKEVLLPHWNNNLLYFVSNKALWQYDVVNKQAILIDSLGEKIEKQTIIDYLIKNQKLYLLTKNNTSENLWVGNLNSPLASVALPTGAYHFINQDSPKITLSNGKQAYVIDEPLPLIAKLRLLPITNTVAVSQWQNDSLIYATPFELRRWSGENNDQLLTRFGSPLIALWPMDNGLVIADAETIRIYVNNRQPFSLTLAAMKNITALIAANDKTKLFIYGTYRDKTGLFSLEIN